MFNSLEYIVVDVCQSRSDELVQLVGIEDKKTRRTIRTGIQNQNYLLVPRPS
jgi:hypothetical protein